ncbi:MAG: hypothetical protein RugAbin2_01236, partial [Rugosibacter sp.]|nr:hypothetical protein [Rugosibacter sp.]
CVVFPLNAQSQTVKTRQPCLRSPSLAAWSRAMFLASFRFQKARFDLGNRTFPQLCACQKHPWTKITAPHFGKVMSGDPANDLLWTR